MILSLRRSAMIFILVWAMMFAACGGTPGLIQSEGELEEAQESSGDDSSNDSTDSDTDSDTSTDTATDTSNDVTTETTSAVSSGDIDNVPVATEVEDFNITLNCTDRNTDSPDIDYVTVTCGSGESAQIEVYYCNGEIVTLQEDDSELFSVTTIECTVEEDGSGTIVEEETIVG